MAAPMVAQAVRLRLGALVTHQRDRVKGMDMIEITVETVQAGLEARVRAAGRDFVYTPNGDECTYVWDGKPDCIVGCFLFDAGVPLERLAKADVPRGGTSAWALMDQLHDEGLVRIDPDACWILNKVQGLQDEGRTWGEAVAGALAAVEEEQM